jgi:hypothetical protein
MCRRISTATAALVTTLMMTVGAVQALEGAKYPDWTGGWRRWAPPNATREACNGGTNLTAGGQPSFDESYHVQDREDDQHTDVVPCEGTRQFHMCASGVSRRDD